MTHSPVQRSADGLPAAAFGVIYLNNAAAAWPKAPGVAEAMGTSVATVPGDPGRSVQAGHSEPGLCRALLAALLGGVSPQRVVLTTSATHALNLAILGLGLKAGDEVVTLATAHNSLLRPLARLQHPAGIRLTVVGLTPDGMPDEEAFEAALRRSPRLVAMDHVSNVTGLAHPVARWFGRARQAGAVTLLDAAQSLGQVPVDAVALNADLVAFTGHKALRGPPGTGGLYVAPGMELEQVLVGGTGTRSDLSSHPGEMPDRLEAGTPNVPALAGLAAALRWQGLHGEAFRAAGRARGAALRKGLRGVPRVRVIGDAPAGGEAAIVSFCVAGWSVGEAGFVLSEGHGIVCRTGLHCAPLAHRDLGCAPDGTIRFSPSGATTADEVEVALAAVRGLAA